MVDHHQKASKPRTPPESHPRIGLTGDSHFETCFFRVGGCSTQVGASRHGGQRGR